MDVLKAAKKFLAMRVNAKDGDCGHIRDIYFDDEKWTARYFLLDTGKWLPGKLVLISPMAIDEVDFKNKTLEVNLTKKQIEESPNPSEHKPISRQMEEKYADYYDFPLYWPGSGVWPAVGYDLAYYASFKNRGLTDYEKKQIKKENRKQEQHLRTVNEVKRYLLQATDGLFGHVEDFIIDDETWELRYLVVDTVNWWPSRSVIFSPRWVADIDWSESKIILGVEKEKVKNSPSYTEENLDRDYEIDLYDYYQEPKYWEYEKMPLAAHERHIKKSGNKARKGQLLY